MKHNEATHEEDGIGFGQEGEGNLHKLEDD